jgi:hypothetical protein
MKTITRTNARPPELREKILILAVALVLVVAIFALIYN